MVRNEQQKKGMKPTSDQNSNNKEQKESRKRNNEKFVNQVIDRAGVVQVLAKNGKDIIGCAWCNNAEALETIRSNIEQKDPDYTDIFMTFNKPKDEACVDKKLNKFYSSEKCPGTFFKDDSIEKFNWLFVDVDPIAIDRPASKESNSACQNVAKQIKKDLKELGFSDPVVVSTGNGFALFYPLVGYKNKKEVKDAISAFLRYLTENYSTTDAKVDTSVGNASRYCRVPGTTNRKSKGDSKEDYKICEVVWYPSDIVEISSKVFKSALKQLSIQVETSNQNENNINEQACNDQNVQILDVPRYLGHYGLEVVKIKKENGFTIYGLDKCVFDPTHEHNEASIVQQVNGKISYQCFHDSCKGNDWFGFREKVSGSDRLQQFMRGESINFSRSIIDPSDVTITRLSEVLDKRYESTPLIKNLIDEGEMVIWGGPPGVGKSALTCAVGLYGGSASRANMFDLFEFGRPLNTLFLQSEVTDKHIKNRFKLMIKQNPELENGVNRISFMGHRDSCRITGKFSDPSFQALLIKAIVENNIDLVVVDPLISFIDGLPENDNSAMRKELDCLKKACEYATASVILIHHTGKDGKGLRGASAIDGWADRINLLESVKKDGEECVKFVFEKTRNQEKLLPILIKKTGLRFERIQDADDDEMAVVVSALQEFPGGIAKTQTALIKKLCDTKGMKDSTAYRKIKKAIEGGLIIEDDQGSAKSYKLVKQ